eukprot:TRINITY_DN19309_c0_g6_i1.p1 TRINITY_DN19309_c0_g6~~TRINITY_DN19309_c0_g6_i1.p1  ORF type:complete len:397 (+),score=51.76 TRINITY_DN19309_c0_g6_i1:52-1242(+)
MGNATTRDNECQILAVTGASRQQAIKDFMSASCDKDLYELFELERYACPDASGRFEQQIKAKFREFALQYHPDKNSFVDEETKADYAKVLVYITNGKNILLDPDAKHRYDIELRRTRLEESSWDSSRWWSRWISNVALLAAGGIGLIIGGGLAVGAATGGAALALSIAGSCMLSAGIRGSLAHYQDPHAINYDYAKQICIGALTGGFGGACAEAAQGATIAAQVGIAAAGGAGTAVAAHVIEDTVNVLDGTQSAKDLVTSEHLSTVGTSIAIGACAGLAIQGVACGFQSGAEQSQQIVDDAARVAKNAAIGTVVSTVTSLAEEGVEHQRARYRLENMVNSMHRYGNGHAKDPRAVPLEAADARAGVNAETVSSQEASYFENILRACGMTMVCSLVA